MKPLSQHTILVTGASSGLGREIALGLAAKGSTVYALARREDRLHELVQAGEGRIHSIVADLTEEGIGLEIRDRLSGLDGVILNAGRTSVGKFMDGDNSDDTAILDLNVMANIRLTRALLPSLASGGHILFTGSLAGLAPVPGQAVYSGSKAFLTHFVLALREELRGTDQSVGLFAPGGIKTEMTDISEMDGLRSHLADPQTVAAAAIKAYLSRDAVSVPGLSNKAAALAVRLLPRPWVTRVLSKIYDL